MIYAIMYLNIKNHENITAKRKTAMKTGKNGIKNIKPIINTKNLINGFILNFLYPFKKIS